MNSDPTMMPASSRFITRFPLVRRPTRYTSVTDSRLAQKAYTVTVTLPCPVRMASAAPKHAPEDAPKMSGAAMGF